jgi:hypothetical protein
MPTPGDFDTPEHTDPGTGGITIPTAQLARFGPAGMLIAALMGSGTTGIGMTALERFVRPPLLENGVPSAELQLYITEVLTEHAKAPHAGAATRDEMVLKLARIEKIMRVTLCRDSEAPSECDDI